MQLTSTIIMPALNEEDSVQRTLDSILASSRLPDEIVVADGGSSDRTAELVRSYADRGIRIQLVDNPLVFPGETNNKY